MLPSQVRLNPKQALVSPTTLPSLVWFDMSWSAVPALMARIWLESLYKAELLPLTLSSMMVMCCQGLFDILAPVNSK